MDIGNKINGMDIKVYAADNQTSQVVKSSEGKAAKMVAAVVKERSIQDNKSGSAKVIDFSAEVASRSSKGVPRVKTHSEQQVEVINIPELASEVKSQLKSFNTEVRVSVDNDSGNIVFKILGPETNDLIKQIPSEEMLAISRRLAELLEDYSSMQEDRKKVISVFQDTILDSS